MFGLSVFWSTVIWLIIAFNGAVCLWAAANWWRDRQRDQPERFEHWPTDEAH